ncbi:MAG: LON peptidase substrate-binding domain-containing protein [Ideonella sp.]
MNADRESIGDDTPGRTALPLFPLRSVLFPGGLLMLKVFEARYLDLMSRCLRSGDGFGVIALRQGSDVRNAETEAVDLEPVGVLARIIDVDSPQSGILDLRCQGTRRFATESVAQQADGLWTADVEFIADDEPAPPGEQLAACVAALVDAIDTLTAQGAKPFLEPMNFADAGWVANRWCEILPITLAAKQKLMALEDPLIRLGLVDDFLRNKGVIG